MKDPLLWWVGMEGVYPHLLRMARNYLIIPGMFLSFYSHPPALFCNSLLATSVDVERVFSKGWLILSHVRNQLTVASTRALMCLGDWSMLGLVEDADIKAVVRLPDVIDDDDLEWDLC